jgi:hydroxyethylthiazole kinase-like uncharacterized protein yjeF
MCSSEVIVMNEVKSDVINVRDSLPQPVWRTEAIRQMEQQIVASQHITMYQLMERAGVALFQTLQSRWPSARTIWILCGKGNNGGDGYVVARLARQHGFQVKVAALDVPAPGITAELAYRDWLKCGGTCLALQDLTVDALLGIGPSTPLRGELPAWIQFINRNPAPVLCVDVPSGLNAENGHPLGCAVHATLTVTMLGLKYGLVTGLSASYVGKLQIASLGRTVWPEHAALQQVDALDYSQIRSLLPPRDPCAHKGNHGKLLIIAGGRGMPGAAHLATDAALRTGSGLVKVCCDPANQAMIFMGRPELMFSQNIDVDLVWSSTIVIGPGLGTDDWAQTLWQKTQTCDQPMVVDADALTLLAQQPRKSHHWVLTPHPGEAARLLHCTVADIEADRYTAVSRLQQQYGGVVLLKGPGTLVCDGRHTIVCLEGNPGMASGGMGDVLSGVIGGLLAQGLPLFQAAYAGALIHGKAGNCVAELNGERGMLASDLGQYLQKLVNPSRLKV